MANFKVGDEVVCIDAIPPAGMGAMGSGLVAGKIYLVKKMTDQCVGVLEMPSDPSYSGPCANCGQRWGYWHIPSWRFIKLDGLKEYETEQLTEKV